MGPIDVLGCLLREGRISAQIPDTHMNFSGEAPEKFAQSVNDFEAVVDQLFEQGMVAWKVANPKPGLDKVLYTREARNPQTQRLVSAFLWMTPLAVSQYGQELYKLYTQGCAEREKSWAGAGQAEDFDSWQNKMLANTVPAAADFAQKLPPQILAATTPKKTTSRVTYGKPGKDGFAERISTRKFKELDYAKERGEKFLAKLDALNVGPNTLIGAEGGTLADLIVHRVIERAGARGVDWMLEKGFESSTEWFAIAANRLDGSQSLALWNHLVAKGVDPKGQTGLGTLWHALLFTPPRQDEAAHFDWLRAQGVDWHAPNPGGELPAAKLISKLCQKMGQADFYDATPGGNVMMAVLMMIGQGSKELKDEKQQAKALEQILMDMIADGVDLTRKNNQGVSALDCLHPDQVSAQAYLTKRGENFFTCDPSALKRAPEAYGPAQRAFIQRLEMATGFKLLDDPEGAQPKPRQARP